MKGSGLRRMVLVVAVCALVGAVAGIAGSAAAPSKSKSAKAAAKARMQARGFRGAFRHGPGGFGPGPMGGPAVHAQAIVPKADGSGFDTVTMDAGTLNSVDGTTVHLKEATTKATYKDDAAIDVGSNATVIRNHAKAALSDLKAGDHVRVIQGPNGNTVLAEDDAFLAQEQKEHQGFDHHGMGPGGPPPGVPGMYPGSQQGSSQSGNNS